MESADGQEDQARPAGDDERVSILGVAKHRLPIHLAVFTVAVIALLVVAIVRSWDSIGEIVLDYPYLLNTFMPAVVTLLIAVEGGIMGGTALLLKLNREKAVEEGRKKGRLEGHQEGRQEGIQEGHQKGVQEGRQEGIQEGRRKGRREGIRKGRREGIREGRQEGIRETIQFLEKSGKGDVAQFLREQSNGRGGDQR